MYKHYVVRYRSHCLPINEYTRLVDKYCTDISNKVSSLKGVDPL